MIITITCAARSPHSICHPACHLIIAVYDLDVAPPYLDRDSLLRVNGNVELRRFAYHLYPRFFNITVHAGYGTTLIFDLELTLYSPCLWCG